ncbi:MAG: alpha-hydroxy acid oxidase [Gordonia paraffinivorans]
MTDTMYPTAVEFGSLDEIHETALGVLPGDVADFLEGGAGGETTLLRNRQAFSRWAVVPEPMSGVALPDTRTSLLGIPLSAPLLAAPFGGDTLFHPDGHRAVMRAAEEFGVVDIAPEAGSFSYADLRAAAPSAARIAQLHPFAGAVDVAARIADIGYDALCVTVDCPVGGFRTRNMRNRFSPDLTPFCGNTPVASDDAPRVAEVMGQLMSGGGSAWTWDDLSRAARRFRLPWIAKGVLTPATALRAMDAGATGVVVSNHGGRQVDPAPSSLAALPAVRAAVGSGVPVLVDSGFRSGADVFVALALGADAVVLGRSVVYGVAAGGEAGVTRVLDLVTEELRVLMTLAGAADVQAVTSDRVVEIGR